MSEYLHVEKPLSQPAQGAGYRLRHTQVTVCEGFDGTVTFLHQGKTLDYICWVKGDPPPLAADDKEINALVDEARVKQYPSTTLETRSRPSMAPRVDAIHAQTSHLRRLALSVEEKGGMSTEWDISTLG